MAENALVLSGRRASLARFCRLCAVEFLPCGGIEGHRPPVGGDAVARRGVRRPAAIRAAGRGAAFRRGAVRARNAAQVPETDASPALSGIKDDRCDAALRRAAAGGAVRRVARRAVRRLSGGAGARTGTAYPADGRTVVCGGDRRLSARGVDLSGTDVAAPAVLRCGRGVRAEALLSGACSRSLRRLPAVVDALHPVHRLLVVVVGRSVQGGTAGLTNNSVDI